MRDSWDLRDLRTLRDPQGTRQTLDARRRTHQAPDRLPTALKGISAARVTKMSSARRIVFCVGGGRAIHWEAGSVTSSGYAPPSPDRLSRSSPQPYLLRPISPVPISSAFISSALISPALIFPVLIPRPYLLRSHPSALISSVLISPSSPPSFLHSHPLARISPARIPPSSPISHPPRKKYNA